MKKVLIPALVTLFILSGASQLQAQKREPMPDNATWQLVSNINNKSTVTVQFYTNDGILMYEETLHNVKLNIQKKKTVRKLNAVLKQVHSNWVINRSKTAETDLIARKLNP